MSMLQIFESEISDADIPSISQIEPLAIQDYRNKKCHLIPGILKIRNEEEARKETTDKAPQMRPR